MHPEQGLVAQGERARHREELPRGHRGFTSYTHFLKFWRKSARPRVKENAGKCEKLACPPTF
eukprot:3402118-Prymnesium_polylepis.1